jgi:hypothetical protein
MKGPTRSESDRAYVERIRKGYLMGHRLRLARKVLALALFFLPIITVMLTVDVWSDLMQRWFADDGGRPVERVALVVGLMLGVLLGYWFCFAAFAIGDTVFERRKDRLLIECWDAHIKDEHLHRGS